MTERNIIVMSRPNRHAKLSAKAALEQVMKEQSRDEIGE